MPEAVEAKVVVLISADAEWKAIRKLFPEAQVQASPFGQWFLDWVEGKASKVSTLVRFFQGGWGKVSAAASTQYVIDHWQPELLINLGTCGGFAGEIAPGDIVLADKTLIYDIYELMGDPVAHLSHYTTCIDLSWLGGSYPQPVVITTLVSGDRDLNPAEIPELRSRFAAVAGDWESGAIAWVAGRNNRRCLILRGVSDLVGATGSLAYTHEDYFDHAAFIIMQRLVTTLPDWIYLAIK